LIRQLRRLTRPVPALGDGAKAIAVYAHPAADGLREHAAAEQGFEGVACVDDAARAALVYAALWRQHRLAWAHDEAAALLAFVRAMHALACGVSAFGDAACAESFERGLPWLDRPTPHLDVRAVGVLAAVEYWRATRADHVAARALAWASEIAAAARGDVLPNQAGGARIHLWGHLQEAALAEAGMAFGRADLVECARRSAEVVLAPPVGQHFPGSPVLPFDVSCVVRGLDAVATATGEARYSRLADAARGWFGGRNWAGRPVYDRDRGLVHDGIDNGRVSENSGAEANIEGALALLASLPLYLYERFTPSALPGAENLEEEHLHGEPAHSAA